MLFRFWLLITSSTKAAAFIYSTQSAYPKNANQR